MGNFRIAWVDLVLKSAQVEASSKEEAIRMVKDGEVNRNLIQEEDVEFHQEPYIDGEE